MPRTFVIAEAGVNHDGSLDRAKQLVDAAARAGADAVKFQTFRAEALTTRHAGKADYQVETTGASGSQLDMLRALELGEDGQEELARHCSDRGIEFVSTPFDVASARFLIDTLDVARVKIGSGDLTTSPLLLDVGRSEKPVILSTGMASMGEIEEALGVLAFAMTADRDATPSRAAFREAFSADAARAALRDRITVLQCTTAYPAPFDHANLRVMETLRTAFRVPVGLSDHTLGVTVPIAAAALGARVVEKHFTLDKTLPGPDHRASLEPDELEAMIASIREVELALGNPVKHASALESENAKVARKSLVATSSIRRGQPFTEQNLGFKRPGTGVSPALYWDYLGRTATRDYEPDDLIDP